MASKRQCLDTDINISNNSLKTRRIDKNSYKELGSTPNERIDENSELGLTFDEKIGKNSYKELESTLTKKIGKSLNKKLKPSFIHNDIHLRQKAAIIIIEINSKVYKLKTYNERIVDPIYGKR